MNAPSKAYTLDFIRSLLTEKAGRVSGTFKDLQIKTAFQPIFSLPHKRAIGFDASLRGTDPDGKPVAAESLFAGLEDYADTSLLDLLCTTIHVHNFTAGWKSPGLLFLNLHPDVFLDSELTSDFLVNLLGHFQIPEGSLVIDVPGAVLRDERLGAQLDRYRQLGCLISVDDFGVENSDLDTIWDSTPAVVKMGRSVIADTTTDKRAQQALPRVVSLLHEMGTLVLMEGVETEMEARVAIDADADFACGFFFGRSYEDPAAYVEPTSLLGHVWSTYKSEHVETKPKNTAARALLAAESLHSSKVRKLKSASPAEINRYREARRPFITAIQHGASLVKSGEQLDTACSEFLALPGAIDCYMLNADGRQIGGVVTSHNPPVAQSMDFSAVAAPADADWSRREYFRRALNGPEIAQVTRQYCSLGGHTHCVTFSVATTVEGKPVVVCGDVDWPSRSRAET
jgi:EAL domain-containing protein (putative c-di-GMP-specific phosphodiesterase class I)